MKIKSSQKLIEIALDQKGYFTAKQAIDCGVISNNHHYYVKKGEWIREIRGIYRMSVINMEPFDNYWFWYLWSRDRTDVPQGVFSHETALALYELSDINPRKIHMTVPKSFRKGTKIPKIIYLHKGIIAKKDIKTIEGFKVTSPLKTVIDLMEENRISPEFIEQAVKEAMKRGLITRTELKENPNLARYAI